MIALLALQLAIAQELKVKKSKEYIDFKPVTTPFYTGYRPHPNPLQTEFPEGRDFGHRIPVTYDASYDLRTTAYLTSVKNQGSCGACWTFSTMGALESHLKKSGTGTFDLSEQNLKNRHGFDYGPCDGGETYMSTCYLVRGDGPVLESEDPYSVSNGSSSYYTPQIYVGEALYLPDDANTLKSALLTYGALATNMYWNPASYHSGTYTYYDNSGSTVNHGVTLVGWDDNKVVPGAPGNGAWIIKNSWGTGWGEAGYFYISYHDASVHYTVTCWPDHDEYSNNHFVGGYDEIGYIAQIGYGAYNHYALMRYTPTHDHEKVLKIGTWAVATNSVIGITIYDSFSGGVLSSQLAAISNQSTDYAGFYSFSLPDTLSLTKNDDVYIQVKYTYNGYDFPLPVEMNYAGYASPSLETDRYWITYEGGFWQSIGGTYDLCIKVYGMDYEPNITPVFTAVLGSQSIMENNTITFDYNATDGNGDDLTFSLHTYSPGMTINSATGLFSWTPSYTQAGLHDVIVNVSDGIETVSSSTGKINVFNVNRAPDFSQELPDTTMVATSTLTYSYIADDPDIDDDLEYSLSLQSPGMMIHTTTGVFSWTPSIGQEGAHYVRVTVNDGTTSKNSTQTRIDVTELNHAPVFTEVMPDTAIDENEALSFTFEASDEEDDNLTYSLKNQSGGMSIHSTSGVFAWTPTFSQAGSHSFKVTVSDGKESTDTETITVSVNNVNRPPVFTAVMPDRTFNEFDSTSFQYAATDPDDQVLTYFLEPLTGGSLANNGLFKFVSSRVFSDTTIQVVIQVSDGSATVSDTAFLNITNINEPPEFVTVLPDTVISENQILLFTFTAQDIEMDVLTFSLTDSSAGMTIHSTTGEFSWQPGFFQAGSHPLKVAVNDGLTSTLSPTITLEVLNVNRPPVFTDVLPDTQTIERNLLQYTFLANDEDGDEPAYFLIDSSQGMLIDKNTGLFQWQPTYYQSGDHIVQVVTSDGVDSTLSGPATISVQNLNQAPVFTRSMPDTMIMEFDTLIYHYEGNDPDSDDFSFTLSSPLPDASIDINGLFQYVSNQIFSDTSIQINVMISDGLDSTIDMTNVAIVNIDEPPVFMNLLPDTLIAEMQTLQYQFQGSDPEKDILEYTLVDSSRGMVIEVASGLFTWKPDFYQSGVHSLLVNLSDGSSNVLSDSIIIEVTHVNQPPQWTVLLPDTQIFEQQELKFSLQGTDPDEDAVVYGLADSSAGMMLDTLSGSFSWIPGSYQSGQHTARFSISDSIVTVYADPVIITVINQNQLPYFTVVLPDTQAYENQSFTYAFQGNDDDGDTVTYMLTDSSEGMSIDSISGIFSWTPNFFQSGDHWFKVGLSDDFSRVVSDTFSIEVIHVNQPPQFTTLLPDTQVHEMQKLVFDFDGEDLDGDKVIFVLTDFSDGMTLDSGSGIFSWTPDFHQAGNHQIQISLSDGMTTTGSEPIEIVVKNTNQSPYFTKILPDTTIQEKDTLEYQFEANDNDKDSVIFSLPDSISGMEISTTGLFCWIPDYDQSGLYPFQVEVSDSKDTVLSSVLQIMVKNRNRWPLFTKVLPDTFAVSGSEFNFSYEGYDADGDTLHFALISDMDKATMEPGGALNWNPDEIFEDTLYQIVVSLTDDTALVFDTAEVRLLDKQYAPEFTMQLPDTGIDENQELQFQYLANDPDGDTIVYKLVLSSNGMMMDSLNGLFQWIPGYKQAGEHLIRVQISDGLFKINSTIAKIHVNNVNRAPYFSSVLPDTLVDYQSTLRFQYEAIDPDADPLFFSLVTAFENTSLDTTGFFQWEIGDFTTDTNFRVIISASDGDLTCLDTAQVSIAGRVAIEEHETGIPDQFVLYQNYPNPFNPATVIRYGLPLRTMVKITVYDITGRTVSVLENETREAGFHGVIWNSGSIASGIYFYKIETPEFVTVKKCLFMK